MNLKVHLFFPGTCEEALSFYKETLDGEINFLFRKKEDKTTEVADIDKEKISYMVVKTPHFDLAGEDANHDQEVIVGNNNKLVLLFQKAEEGRLIFDKFTQNGTIITPFEKTFFSDGFGEIVDKYGITWLIMVAEEGCSA